ncbi:hypothetical protein CDAR_562881 [Caerostris darwini]|uniref:Uncharacterized protein n=1 Tax=Caerostris darwini TaxID=1538125 RepID=A0AAV4X9G0_9ARAC|nr:hypothetical protein CDAR_562881 [Caerostris darwini]
MNHPNVDGWIECPPLPRSVDNSAASARVLSRGNGGFKFGVEGTKNILMRLVISLSIDSFPSDHQKPPTASASSGVVGRGPFVVSLKRCIDHKLFFSHQWEEAKGN